MADLNPNNSSSKHSHWLIHLMIGTLLGVAALGWAIRGFDLSAVLSVLAAASPGWITLSLITVVAVAMTKAARWGVLYSVPTPQTSFWNLFSVLVSSQMVNIVIPVRVGELTRIGFMKQAGQPGATTLSTIVVEKALDVIAVGLIAVSVVSLTVTPIWLQESASGVLLVGLILIIGLGLVWWLRDSLEQLLARLLALGGWLPILWQDRIINVIRTALDALSTLTDLRSLAFILFWTIISWLLPMLTILTLFAAFGLQMSIVIAGIMLLALSLSYLVPSLPGRVGVRHALAVGILIQYGVSQTTATGFGIALNVVTIVPLLLLGGLALWPRTLLTFSWLRQRTMDKPVGE